MKTLTFLLSAVFFASLVIGQDAYRTQKQILGNDTKSISLYGFNKYRNAIDNCDAESIGANPWGTAGSATTSELSEGYAVATQFSTIGGTIETINVWMVSLYNAGGSWFQCAGEPEMTVNVYFIEDNAGVLGDTLYSFYDVVTSRVPAGIDLFDIADYPVEFMTINLPSGVDMNNGFLLIQGTSIGDPNCWLMWINNEDGSEIGYQYNDGWNLTDYGFTYCLLGTPPSCPIPSNLTFLNITSSSVELSWNQVGDSDSWDIEYGLSGFTPTETPTIAATTDNPIVISDLDAGTAYDFYIRANCEEENSDWVGPVTTYTANCELANQCVYTFELIDSWGDGWNGGALIIEENGIVVDQITLLNGDFGTEYVSLCNAENISITFIAGFYPDEIGFNIIDPDGNELYSVTPGTLSEDDDQALIHSFVTDCPDCIPPMSFQAESGYDYIELSWLSYVGLYNIEWGEEGFTQGEGTLLEGVDENPYTISGLNPGTAYDFYVQADCDADGTSVWVGPLTATTDNCIEDDKCTFVVEMVDSYGDGWNDGALIFYENGIAVAEATLLSGSSGTANISLCDQAEIQVQFIAGSWPGEIGFTIYDPFGVALFNVEPEALGEDYNETILFTFTTNCTPPACPMPTNLNAIAGTLDAELSWTSDADIWNIEWDEVGFTQGEGTLIEGVDENPYTLSGLSSGTTYAFYVQADCENDGTSTWAGPFVFATEHVCDIIDTYPFFEGFEGGVVPPACWTSIDADGDGFNWMVVPHSSHPAHSGEYSAMSASWDSNAGELTPDNYLVTPQLDINAENLTLSFWAAAQDGDYPEENYSVMVSTTGNNPEDFTDEIFTETLSSDEWHQVVIPLADYYGSHIYIAWRHWDVTDQFQMKVDDILIDHSTDITKEIVKNVSLYPNPTTGQVSISNVNGATVSVTNMLGHELLRTNSYDDILTIDASIWEQGTYIVRIINNGEVNIIKFNLVK